MLRKILIFSIILSSLVVIACEKKVVEVRYAPVLYNLAAPDSIPKGSPSIYYLFISAFDPDGLDDIETVYFISTRPDSTSSGSQYPLRDDGQFGDSTANDGRFSLGIQAPADTAQSGDYIFTFYAKDRQGNNSNNPAAVVTAY
jgi:hypothetical protein